MSTLERILSIAFMLLVEYVALDLFCKGVVMAGHFGYYIPYIHHYGAITTVGYFLIGLLMIAVSLAGMLLIGGKIIKNVKILISRIN